MHFEESAELVAKVIDAVGLAVIVGRVVLAMTFIARSRADWDQRFAITGAVWAGRYCLASRPT